MANINKKNKQQANYCYYFDLCLKIIKFRNQAKTMNDSIKLGEKKGIERNGKMAEMEKEKGRSFIKKTNVV